MNGDEFIEIGETTTTFDLTRGQAFGLFIQIGLALLESLINGRGIMIVLKTKNTTLRPEKDE